LLEGVNTSAKNIIITKPSRNYNNTFDAFDFYNLVGRTGRLYQHYLGVAHYIKTPEDPLYEKSAAVKSIEFELTDNSIDMDINFGDYSTHPEFVEVLNQLGISYEQYKETIARKHRFSTVKMLLDNYHSHKHELLDVLYRQMVDPEQSKIELVRVLCKILGIAERNFQLNTYIINCLTYKIRKTVREVVDDSMKYFPGAYIPSVINTTIRYKSSYIEFTFYNQIDLVRYFMECEHVSPELIATLHERLMKNIEVLQSGQKEGVYGIFRRTGAWVCADGQTPKKHPVRQAESHLCAVEQRRTAARLARGVGHGSEPLSGAGRSRQPH